MIRWGVVIGVFVLGWKSMGWEGGVMALVIFGFLCIFFYTACDAWGAIKSELGRPRITNEDHSQNVHIHSATPGQPTSQEWAAIVEVGRRELQQQSRQKGISRGY